MAGEVDSILTAHRSRHHKWLAFPSGNEVERIGLVSLAIGHDELESSTLSVARRLAAGSPNALQPTKRTATGLASD